MLPKDVYGIVDIFDLSVELMVSCYQVYFCDLWVLLFEMLKRIRLYPFNKFLRALLLHPVISTFTRIKKKQCLFKF